MITGLSSLSFPNEEFVTLPSGPLSSTAQLLPQSHIYTLPTHTLSHSLTRTHRLYLSIFCLHTHAPAHTSNI